MTGPVIEIGKRYIGDDGKIVTIVRKVKIRRRSQADIDETFDAFEGSNGIVYHEDGVKFTESTIHHPRTINYYEDLIFEVVD